jgi:alkylhydroperoxidase family enzyme
MAMRPRAERLAECTAALRRAVLGSAAASPVELRRAAFDGVAAEPAASAYVAAVRNHAYRITDADVAALRLSGLSDDAIFEVTVAAALGAAQRCLDTGLAALGLDPQGHAPR